MGIVVRERRYRLETSPNSGVVWNKEMVFLAFCNGNMELVIKNERKMKSYQITGHIMN